MCLGYQKNERERLKIKAFYVRLVYSKTHKDSLSPQSLTLHYLPRINGSVLEVNGSVIRPDSHAFVTLHRVVSPEKKVTGGVMYGSREKVRASEGLKFEIYAGDVKVLNGIFRKNEEGYNWKMECTCGFENGGDVDGGVKEADVSVEVDGDVAGVVSEKVVMVVRRKSRRRCPRLEGIPEEREVEDDDDEYESDGCSCFECKGEVEMDGVDLEMEGVRWVVDVGIWVMCLGVGYMVTKASSKRLRRKFI